MKVKLKKLNENARLPEKAYEGDLCYDVRAVSEEEIAPNVWKYKLGFAYEIDRGNLQKLCLIGNDKKFYETDYNISIDFRPRSSIWKTGMVLSNSCWQVRLVKMIYRQDLRV